MTVRQRERAQKLYRLILDELKTSSRCVVVIGLEGGHEIIRWEAVDRWLTDPTRYQCVLYTANHSTTLGDVEWLLSL